MLRETWKLLLIGAGWLCVGLGVIGIILPLLPTTPFLLLAAFFFSRGSTRLHQWLLSRPRLGPAIQAWESQRVIPLRGKWAATLVMVPSVTFALATRPIPLPLVPVILATVVAVLGFIWSRPSRPRPGAAAAAP